jgi:hypothetical protein
MQSKQEHIVMKNEKGIVLVVVIMLMAVLVLLGTTAIMVTTTDMKISSNYREGTRAFYNADAGVDTVIAYLRTNTVSYPTTDAAATVIAENTTCSPVFCTPIPLTVPTGFSFAAKVLLLPLPPRITPVYLYGKNVADKLYVFRMTGTGYNNASETLEVYIKRVPLYPEGADGAVAMYGGGPAVQFKTGGGGGYAVDGHDYPVPTNSSCNGSACNTTATALPAVPGLFTVMTPTLTGDVGAHLGGATPVQKIGASREAEYNDFAQMIIDSGSTGTPLYQDTLGTRTNPAITVIPNGTTLNGTGNGAGIIIIDNGGSLQVNGNFEYEGLVILRGTGRVFGAGTGNIFGSIITIGHTAKLIDLTGAINLFYSSAALSNLSNINSINTTQRVAWRNVL